MLNLLSPLAPSHTVRSNGDDASGPVLGDASGHVRQLGAQLVLGVFGRPVLGGHWLQLGAQYVVVSILMMTFVL